MKNISPQNKKKNWIQIFRKPKLNLIVFVYCQYFIFIQHFNLVEAQLLLPTRDPRFYSREGVDFPVQNPGDPDYRTYTHNDRRYGFYQPNGYGQKYPGQYKPDQYPQGYPQGQDTFRYDPNNPSIPLTPFPGILGGWRKDLQGKQRPDSVTLDPQRNVFVTTNYGQVQGFKVAIYDDPDPKSFYRPYHSPVDQKKGECSVFLGIPYALPPVNEGRFKPPRLHRGWQLLQAVDFGPACPQHPRFTGATKGIRDVHEDCLYLNVFSPKTGGGAVPEKYPVMIYIHGGHFERGASNLFPGHILATFYNVVVVTINYRLGALGFLSTADENSPGNYGILDQSMAIRWVYENIEFFNGDRNLITLFGPDAGAASAGLLAVAPQTKHMIGRVIGLSGSAFADWALISDKYRSQNTSRVLGQKLGCYIDSSWKLVNCLRSRSFEELGNAELDPQVGTFAWGPVLDKNFTYPGDDWYEGWRESDWKFLSEMPEKLYRENKFNKGLHYMTGVTTQEAASFIFQNDSLKPNYIVDEKFFQEKIREFVLRYNYTLNPNGVFEAIKYMYTYHPDPKNVTWIREMYINFLSDFLYTAPVDKMAKLLLEKKVPVYIFVLNTTIEAFSYPEWRKYPHDIEHYLLTGAPFMDVEFFPTAARFERNMWTDNDRNMSHFFMQTFSNFARFGNPTPQQVLGLHFEKAYQGELRYLNINTTFNSTIKMNYRQTESAFWMQYLPTVIGVLIPTYPPTTEFWWEPHEPLQIAFWSMTAACLLLIVLVFICCIMWRNSKLKADRLEEDIFFIDNVESTRSGPSITGIENTHMLVHNNSVKSRDNIYEYRESTTKKKPLADDSSTHAVSSIGVTQKFGSQISLKSGISAKDNTSSFQIPTMTQSVEQKLRNKIENDPKINTSGTETVFGVNNVKETSRKQPHFSSEEKSLLVKESCIISPEKDSISNRSITGKSSSISQTPPLARLRSNVKHSPRTMLFEGIPQTSV
ncbi:neuroligin-4, Y-linked [Condylostylus longicornis]|uniref:neuroligin-4, Y-linked n=1 Tax=Condylostylus longicornis TaxID=2530218 RepID=UPI00244DC550|nr:neuroligin-4, Y-linked [Condylostylus longicornis]XP_055382110.1 neuroligin-4, Y-linked [Condylostylus longicornis]XP_055382111.1 neuroligin-4, Y-linked [Condylostylus longicornis]XP_055382112.1 neuroligin-4, Y-linked [Condylostylus longicornis]XP_055382113.1 neuroligin-4, Y-linked [Condylostylus longicornis]